MPIDGLVEINFFVVIRRMFSQIPVDVRLLGIGKQAFGSGRKGNRAFQFLFEKMGDSSINLALRR
jgi:hypothetical protein